MMNNGMNVFEANCKEMVINALNVSIRGDISQDERDGAYSILESLPTDDVRVLDLAVYLADISQSVHIRVFGFKLMYSYLRNGQHDCFTDSKILKECCTKLISSDKEESEFLISSVSKVLSYLCLLYFPSNLSLDANFWPFLEIKEWPTSILMVNQHRVCIYTLLLFLEDIVDLNDGRKSQIVKEIGLRAKFFIRSLVTTVFRVLHVIHLPYCIELFKSSFESLVHLLTYCDSCSVIECNLAESLCRIIKHVIHTGHVELIEHITPVINVVSRISLKSLSKSKISEYLQQILIFWTNIPTFILSIPINEYPGEITCLFHVLKVSLIDQFNNVSLLRRSNPLDNCIWKKCLFDVLISGLNAESITTTRFSVDILNALFPYLLSADWSSGIRLEFSCCRNVSGLLDEYSPLLDDAQCQEFCSNVLHATGNKLLKIREELQDAENPEDMHADRGSLVNVMYSIITKATSLYPIIGLQLSSEFIQSKVVSSAHRNEPEALIALRIANRVLSSEVVTELMRTKVAFEVFIGLFELMTCSLEFPPGSQYSILIEKEQCVAFRVFGPCYIYDEELLLKMLNRIFIIFMKYDSQLYKQDESWISNAVCDTLLKILKKDKLTELIAEYHLDRFMRTINDSLQTSSGIRHAGKFNVMKILTALKISNPNMRFICIRGVLHDAFSLFLASSMGYFDARHFHEFTKLVFNVSSESKRLRFVMLHRLEAVVSVFEKLLEILDAPLLTTSVLGHRDVIMNLAVEFLNSLLPVVNSFLDYLNMFYSQENILDNPLAFEVMRCGYYINNKAGAYDKDIMNIRKWVDDCRSYIYRLLACVLKREKLFCILLESRESVHMYIQRVFSGLDYIYLGGGRSDSSFPILLEKVFVSMCIGCPVRLYSQCLGPAIGCMVSSATDRLHYLWGQFLGDHNTIQVSNEAEDGFLYNGLVKCSKSLSKTIYTILGVPERSINIANDNVFLKKLDRMPIIQYVIYNVDLYVIILRALLNILRFPLEDCRNRVLKCLYVLLHVIAKHEPHLKVFGNVFRPLLTCFSEISSTTTSSSRSYKRNLVELATSMCWNPILRAHCLNELESIVGNCPMLSMQSSDSESFKGNIEKVLLTNIIGMHNQHIHSKKDIQVIPDLQQASSRSDNEPLIDYSGLTDIFAEDWNYSFQ